VMGITERPPPDAVEDWQVAHGRGWVLGRQTPGAGDAAMLGD